MQINRHLWLLTGRSSDFVAEALNTGLSYGGGSPSTEVVIAREMLRLGDTTTDYYVVGAMAALQAAGSPAGGDVSTVFLPGALRIKPPTVAGGELRPASSLPPSLIHRPTSLPAGRVWTVSCVDAATSLVSDDAGYSALVPTRFSSGVVYPEWPAYVGFHAAVAPDGGVWEPGSSFTIVTEPSGYPYAAVAASAASSHPLANLLSSEGELSAFHTAPSSIQRVGALVAAVVKRSAKDNDA